MAPAKSTKKTKTEVSVKAADAKTVKKTAETAVEKKEEAPVKKVGRPRGSVNKTKAAEKKGAVAYKTVVEFEDGAVNVEEVVKRAESAFKNDNKRKKYDEFEVYIKPEDNKAYYVAKNGDKEYRDSVPLI